MHGLGNDFVIFDARPHAVHLSGAEIAQIADRKTGVGCDQLIVMEPARDGGDTYMRIYNADGGEVEACGNAARCVAYLMMAETGRDQAMVETQPGPLDAHRTGPKEIEIDMGRPHFDWKDIPLAEAMDTNALDLTVEPGLAAPSAVNVGNPHCIFFVEDAEAVELAQVGPPLEHHRLFPERANISMAQVRSHGDIRLRVWERGVGITRACGTAACATAVAAARRGLTDRTVSIKLDGGRLTITWREDDHILMKGPVAESFEGVWTEQGR